MLHSACSDSSLAAGEDLAGTAAEGVRHWIVLEHAGLWPSKPLSCEGIPAAVRDRISRWLEALPGARLQLVRRDAPSRGPLTLLLAHADERRSWLLRFAIDHVESLADLDLPAAATHGSHPGATRVDGPLALVCTHGRRDPCCARLGGAVYRALAGSHPDRTWQTTHVGGHRFAANVVLLPEGICYGRVTAATAAELLERHRAGQLGDMSLARGRSQYSAPEQAAELELRRATGRLELDRYRLVASRRAEADAWTVSFEDRDGSLHEVRLSRLATGRDCIGSCGDELPEPAFRFVAR